MNEFELEDEEYFEEDDNIVVNEEENRVAILQEEFSTVNLIKLLKSLDVFNKRKGEVSTFQMLRFNQNLDITEDIIDALNKKQLMYSKDQIPFVWHIREELNKLLNARTSLIFESRFLRLRDKLNDFLKQFTFTIPEMTDEKEEDYSELEGRSQEEISDILLKREVSNIIDEVKKREHSEKESKAKEQAELYVLSGGEIVPTKELNFDVEFYQAAKSVLEREKNRVNHILDATAQLSESRNTADVDMEISRKLDYVSDKIIQENTRKRRA